MAQDATLERVVGIVRELAFEVGGDRAARAAGPASSLERDVGLGSLERVELLTRLEAAFGRALADGALQIDTPAELARAVAAASGIVEVPGHRQAEVLAEAKDVAQGATTIHEALYLRARAEPGRPSVYLREDDGTETTLEYGRIWREAAAVAGALRDLGVEPGATVALMLPTSVDFLLAFQGILIAGGVPVPIYPPVRLDRLEEYAQRQSAILADAEVRVLITVNRAKPVAALFKAAVASLQSVATVAELLAKGASWGAPGGRAEDPAFIQYTSGSTGSPKGVLLTHANLLANIEAIGRGLELRPTDVGASWLPLYHDMGLIGSWLMCQTKGIPISIQSPLSFLARPERWLWAIHEHRATLSGAPNFAYELCVRRIKDEALEGLDLSSWRCALNGAEPVSPDTLERFARRFARYGFRAEALVPVYGLAENSVAVSFPPLGRVPRVERIARGPFETEGRAVAAPEGDTAALRFVSVGRALPEHEVKIVDDRGDEVAERTVGRLTFRGPSMTAGYYRKPEATAAMTLEGGWLDSGDLAYVADGEIYIAGRLKDLIIKGGRNLVPQEIEEAAAAVPGIRRGCVVAFGLSQAELGTERLIVVAETRAEELSERDRLAREVTERVAAAVELPPDVVALVPPGAVPKTSSGKIRRAATKDLYVSGRLGRPPRTPLLTRARLVASAAGHEVEPLLKRGRRALYILWLAVALPLVALPLWLLVALVPSRRLAFVCGRLTVRWALAAVGCRIAKVEGLEHLDRPGPLVLCSNHASYVDTPLLMAVLPCDFLFVAKREVLGYPVIGTYVRRTGHLTVDRFDFQQGVQDASLVQRAVQSGEKVLLFPEGTFTAAAGLRPFRLGAFKAAVETGTPIVPMAVQGTRQVMRGDHLVPRPGRVSLWIGAPIAPEGDGWRAIVCLRDRVAEAIAAHCGEPRLDLVAGGPERPAPAA
jgi:1-acyl-sn-glycerol-3-phosphate acyltransferase